MTAVLTLGSGEELRYQISILIFTTLCVIIYHHNNNNIIEIKFHIPVFFLVLVYLALYRLDELGIAHFRKFVVSYETNKMHRVRVKLLILCNQD